jgi:bla regulator protein blaR1
MRKDVLALGAFGSRSRLRGRIEALLAHGRVFGSASPSRAAASAIVLLALAIAASFAPRWIAFAQQEPRLAFEVASIKPSDPNIRQHLLGTRSGSFVATDATLKQLVGMAYDLRDHQISGGPKWLDSDRYTIEGKPDSTTPIGPGPAGIATARAMLRSLLADRFKLAVHHETKEEQIYELVIAKGGPKFKEVEAPKGGPRGLGSTGPGKLRGMFCPIGILAQTLSGVLSRSVIDRTGLTGNYDFVLEYTPELGQLQPGQPGPPDEPGLPPPAPDGPSLFTALEEQLGLKLQSAKGPVDIIIIDHAERPDAN